MVLTLGKLSPERMVMNKVGGWGQRPPSWLGTASPRKVCLGTTRRMRSKPGDKQRDMRSGQCPSCYVSWLRGQEHPVGRLAEHVDVGAWSVLYGFVLCSGFRSTYSVTHALLESSVAFEEHWDEWVKCEFLIYQVPFGGGGAAVELTLFLLKTECF